MHGLVGCGTPDIMRRHSPIIFTEPISRPRPEKKKTTKKTPVAEKAAPANKPTRPARPRGLVGCGTPEVMFREQAKKYLKGFEGVVGISFKEKEIVVRVRTQADGEALPKTFYRRKVSFVVAGVIRKR